MRKPINNETQLINEIWNGKLLNERRQSTEPSIYDPRMTNIMTDPATSAINRFLPWADRLSKAAKGYKPRETSETEGPTVSISDEDLESGEIPEIVMEPTIKKTPQFPYWDDGPHGYDITTPEDAKAAEQWRNRYNSALNYAKSRGLSVADASKHAERVASGQWPGDQKGITPELAQSMREMGFTPDQIPQAVIPGDEQQQRFNQILTQMERNWLTRQNAAAAAMQKLADRIADPTGMKARLKAQQGEMSKVSTDQVSIEQPMDAAVDAFKKGAYKPATELGGIEGFAPALSASEFEELGMGVSKPSTAAPAPVPVSASTPTTTRIPIIPGSREEIETILGIAREQPAPVPATTKKTEEPSSFKLGPIASPDSGFGKRISAGAPQSVPSKSAEVKAKLDRTLAKAEKLAAEEKAATPEQKEKIEASAARLSKETGEKITPWSVKHSDAVSASLARSKAALEKARKEAEPKPTPVSAPVTRQEPKPVSTPVTRQEPSQQGRDASNIVPGSQMWGELSAAERQAIRDRYAKGEGPSISIRYNKETDRFDEPGYAPGTGQYADVVTALNMRESVNYYCNFITETTEPKKATKKPTKKNKAKEDLFGSSASSEVTPVSSTTTPAVVVAPVRPVPSGEAFSRKPVHGGRPEAKRLVSTTTTAPATASVTPSASKPTETISGARQLGKTVKRVATSPQMTGGLAGGIAGSLLATIISITSGSGKQASIGADQMQPKSVNTQNTPTTGGGYSLEVPPETNQSQKPSRWPIKK